MQKQQVDVKALQLLNEELIEEQFELSTKEESTLNDLYSDTSTTCKPGALCTGKVLSRSGNGVVVDIAFKSYGIIPNNEFNSQELAALTDGAAIEVLVDRLEDENGSVVLSYQKAKSMKAWERIADLAKEDKPVVGVVVGKVKGGLNVDIGVPAFLPGSQIDIQRINDFDHFLGTEITCKILKINKKRGNVIVSRRRHLEDERQANKSKIMATIVEGQVIQGIAKNITNYGVFVDIGGVDGLLHITDMSWGRVNHPSEMLKIGDSVSVKVIGLNKENEKISLGIKQLSENPWDTVESSYPVNSKISGKISSITDYGLFIEVAPGVEGLVHISEVSWTERITNLNRHYQVGQMIDVLVVALDKQNRRMSLSIKQLTQDPWQSITSKYTIGDKISGRVSNVTDFGVFVELADGIDGLVHVSDISWVDHITHPNEHFKKGDMVEAAVLALDTDNKKISLGIKQLQEDPWQNISSLYPVGTVIEGVVSKVTSFGAFIRMNTGIEGLIHSSELTDPLKVDSTVTCKVIKVNTEDRKIGLSIRAMDPNAPQPQPQDNAGRRQDAAARKKAAEARPATTSMKSVLQQAFQDHADRKKDDE